MAIINPIKEIPWFSIDEDQYLVYLLKGYEIQLSPYKQDICFSLDGLYHREDGPAVIRNDGNAWHYLNGRWSKTTNTFGEIINDYLIA